MDSNFLEMLKIYESLGCAKMSPLKLWNREAGFGGSASTCTCNYTLGKEAVTPQLKSFIILYVFRQFRG